MSMRGRAVVLGDDIDTDIIAPTEFLLAAEADEEGMDLLKRHAFEAVYPGFHEVVQSGDILVAGRNFGLGSHREAANLVLSAFGIQAVVADSIARIYFRNAIAIGMPAISIPGVSQAVGAGDELEISLEEGLLVNHTRGQSWPFPAFTGPVQEILRAGGLIPLMKQRLERTSYVKIGTRE
ncbi:MAG: hypothetical protein K6T81_05925 [Alicyclobacillus macrosporangiidus]|uniref:LeuD/DmdB family oxidoreductase small subunit n=1 Tax=Alicyclobacillus macrosporangiidus TaxID=392015 RepID=UPI0026F1215B|nr:3-isopropylmalate dehydratase [Alicyclobacillus macrosporangiidus]MCL6598264.1 hypothetical protein [Alicyclobacillus macrosporangiidus]